jgi:hypothetical protein
MITVLYFWKIPTSAIPFALLRMALDRLSIKRFKSVSFSKSLGCGKGTTFTPTDVDIHRWGLLICLPTDEVDEFDNSIFVMRWKRRATSEFRLLLDPISSHGKWSGQLPFEHRDGSKTASTEIVAITRARIYFPQIFRFWRSIPPVAQNLYESKGLIHTLGIGEAPIGFQGTFSLWANAENLREFAFKGDAHRRAISDTEKFQWYSEELFARFSVRDMRGIF